MVMCRLANWMGIHQPICLIMTLKFKLVVYCVENKAQYWTGMFWIEDFLAIHLPLKLSCMLVGLWFGLTDFCQLLQGELRRWAHTSTHLKFILMSVRSSVSNWSGLPTSGPVFGWRIGLVWFQTRPKNATCVVLPRLLPGPDINRRLFGRVVPGPRFHIILPATLAPIKYLSCDRIMTWSIGRL